MPFMGVWQQLMQGLVGVWHKVLMGVWHWCYKGVHLADQDRGLL